MLDRRSLLALAAGTLASPMAGCLDGPPADGADESGGADAADASDGDDDSDGAPDDGAESDAEWTLPEPAGSYPEYGDVVGTVAYDEVDPDEVGTYVAPAETSVGPSEPVAFTLHNDRDVRLATNPYGWRLHKRVDGAWFRVAPQGHPDPLTYVEPGESHTWTIRLEPGGVADGRPIGRTEGASELTVSGVGGGEYAFGTTGWFEGGSHREQTAFVATFTFEADELHLAPTDAITAVEWDGDTLVATSDRTEPGDASRLGAFELERLAEPPAEAERVIAEQVVRNHQLRDALALAREYDAERVRVEEYDTTSPIYGPGQEGTYEYRGAYYDVTTRELEE